MLRHDSAALDTVILMPPHSPEHYARFTSRYMGLSSELDKLSVSHGFAFSHNSFTGTGFSDIWSVIMDEKADSGTTNLVRDLTMSLKEEPLYTLAESNDIKLIHTPALNRTIADKGETYDLMTEIFPETVVMRNVADLNMALDRLPGQNIVLKPATGQRSKGVQIVAKKEAAKIILPQGTWLAQEFIDTSVGIPCLEVGKGVHNLRTIVIGGQIIGAVVRHAAQNETILKRDTYGKAFDGDLLPESLHRMVKIGISSLVSKYPEALATVLAFDFAFGARTDGSRGFTTIEVNRRPLRIGEETTHRIDKETGQPVCPSWAARGVTELGRKWDSAEARLLAANVRVP